MIYLNRALDVFNTAVVTPLLYVVFTGCVILASAVLFREWTGLSAADVVGNLCGLLVIVAGIFLLQSFRDLNITMKNLPRARKDDAQKLPNSPSSSLYSPLAEPTDVMVKTMLSRSNSGSQSWSNNGSHSFENSREFHSRTCSYS